MMKPLNNKINDHNVSKENMSLSEVFLTGKKSATTHHPVNLIKPKHRHRNLTPPDWRMHSLGVIVSSNHNQPKTRFIAEFNLNKNAVFGLMIALGLTNMSAFFVSNVPTVSAISHSAGITTSGAQSIDVAPSASGGTGASISADDITVTTTCHAGYNLTISTSVSDNNLYLGGDKHNNADNTYFSPATGSTKLADSPNTWGYLLADSAPTADNVFNPVPRVNSPATIRTPLASPSDTDIHDQFAVYYGVAVSPSMAPGTYKMIPDANNQNTDGTIIYRLTMADACTAYTVSFSPTSTFEGNQLTGTGSVADQTIYEGLTTSLTSSRFAAPSGYYFAGWNTAPDGTGTGYASGQEVTDLAAVGDTITLYAMWTNCPAGKVCYDKNLSSATGTMGNQTASSHAKVTLLATNFSSGDPTNIDSPGDYGFAGWSSRKLDPNDANFRATLATAVSAGEVYGPNEAIDIGSTSPGGKKLYAVWMPVAKDNAGRELTFQTSNLFTTTLADAEDGATLGTKPIGYVTALRDQRDNQVYAVAKLADGRYWMIENLRLDSEYTTGDNINDASATNVALAQGYASSTNYGNFIGLAAPESANFTSSTSANSLYYSGTPDGTASVNVGDTESPNYRIPRYNNSNTSMRAASPTSNNASIYSYGNYYTWPAALANTIYYTTPTMTDADGKTSENAETSLCPRGWTLPRGGNKARIENGTSDLYRLSSAVAGVAPSNYSSNTQPYWADSGDTEGTDMSNSLRRYPTNIIYSGYFYGSQTLSRGSYGYYWSSTTSSASNAYYLHLDSSYLNPGTYSNSKTYGFTIRCAASS